MNLGGQRQHPRVQLDTAVRVRRGDEGPWLNARVVDLSEGGVGLQVHEGMPVGAEVRCSLPLLGARGSDLELRGTVAWIEGSGERPDTKTLVRLGRDDAEPGLPKRSMGLRFEALAADDADRIRTAVRAATARPCAVVLSLEGRSEPITARAEPTDDGLVLRAALPVMRIGATIGVRFGENGDSVVGVVKKVSLADSDGAPELRIELTGRDPDAAEPPAAVAEDADVLDTNAPADGLFARERLEDQTIKTARASADEVAAVRRSGASVGFVFAITVLSIAVGVLIGLKLAERWPLSGIVALAAPAPAPVARALPAAPAPVPAVALVAAAAPPAALPVPPPAAEAPPNDPTAPPTEQAPIAVPAGPAADAPSLSATTTAAATQPAAAEPAPSLEPAAPIAEPAPQAVAEEPAGQGLQVQTLGRVTRVRIPITGSGEGMRVYDLSSPGLTVNLPSANTPVRLGNFAVNTGVARRVWLRMQDSALQVRVIYTRSGVHPQVNADNGALTIDLSL